MAAPVVRIPRELQVEHDVKAIDRKFSAQATPSKVLPEQEIDTYASLDPKSIGLESLLIARRDDKVAVHQVQHFSEENWTDFWEFIPRWANMKSDKNIAELIAYSTNVDFPCVVRPYFSRGTIREVIELETKGKEGDIETLTMLFWSLLKGAASGLLEFHKRDIVHGNLSVSNVLVGDDGEAKLVDIRGEVGGSWRWSCEDYDDDEEQKENHDSDHKIRLLAPELLVKNDYFGLRCTKESDIFALGCCMQEILDSVEANGAQLFTLGHHSLLLRMWAASPRDRPPAEEVSRALTNIGELCSITVASEVKDACKMHIAGADLRIPSQLNNYIRASVQAAYYLTQQCQDSPTTPDKIRLMRLLAIQERRCRPAIVKTLAKLHWLRRFNEVHDDIGTLEKALTTEETDLATWKMSCSEQRMRDIHSLNWRAQHNRQCPITLRTCTSCPMSSILNLGSKEMIKNSSLLMTKSHL